MEEANSVAGPIVGAEGVGAHQFGEVFRLVRIGHPQRTHFVERYAFFSPGAKAEGSLFAPAPPLALTKLGEFYRDV